MKNGAVWWTMAAFLLVVSGNAAAESPFDGTWKGRLTSMKIESKPDVMVLKGGDFRCDTCIPAYTVKADGSFHKVAGKSYWDDVAVSAVDAHTVTYRYRKDDKVVATVTQSVSADGNVVTTRSRNTSNAAGTPIEAVSRQTRIGAPIPGAHLVSGTWKVAPASELSDAALVLTLKLDGKRLHLATRTGETLDAVIGGPYALNVGDPGRTMTKAEQPDPRTLKLTDMRDGKVVDVTTYVVAPDGKTIVGNYEDPRSGEKGRFEATKM